MNKYNLEYFCNNEKQGVIYSKIGKSNEKVWGKGGFFPYRKHIETLVDFEKSGGSCTLEPLDMILNYFHYGDDLIILNFSKIDNIILNCTDDPLNRGCYRSKQVYVEDVKSLADPDTIDYIFNNIADKSLLKTYSNLICQYLEKREFFLSINRIRYLCNL